MKNNLDKSANSLMVCEIINSIVDLFLNTFLVAYLLNILMKINEFFEEEIYE